MSRYIDADKLQRDLAYRWYDAPKRLSGIKVSMLIDEQPTADVVEVVRCKDCKHRPKKVGNEGNGFDYEFSEEYACPGYCEDGYYAELFDDSFYCAWGKR